ncbi:hypothetical protein B0H34DRAFT_113191 [Crassisporium funariophilum]|nr:hypothetical protein B0H34DRAFT_113191 [Crassisporium funariophilum]
MARLPSMRLDLESHHDFLIDIISALKVHAHTRNPGRPSRALLRPSSERTIGFSPVAWALSIVISIRFHKLRKCSPNRNSPHFCVENPQCCVSGHIHLTLKDFASGSYCSGRVLDVGYCSMVYVSSTLHIYVVSHFRIFSHDFVPTSTAISSGC